MDSVCHLPNGHLIFIENILPEIQITDWSTESKIWNFWGLLRIHFGLVKIHHRLAQRTSPNIGFLCTSHIITESFGCGSELLVIQFVFSPVLVYDNAYENVCETQEIHTELWHISITWIDDESNFPVHVVS